MSKGLVEHLPEEHVPRRDGPPTHTPPFISPHIWGPSYDDQFIFPLEQVVNYCRGSYKAVEVPNFSTQKIESLETPGQGKVSRPIKLSVRVL